MKRNTVLFGLAFFALAARADLTVEIYYYGNALCGNNTGYALASPSGGLPPYTYLWSNSAVTDTVTGLAPGNYSVTVTDANSDQASTNVTIVNDMNPVLNVPLPGAGLHGCHGLCNNGFWYHEDLMPLNLTPPFSFNPEPVYGLNEFDPDQGAWIGFCDSWSPVYTGVTDALGCVAALQMDWLVHGTDPGPMSVVDVEPSCEGMNGGSITVNVGYEFNSAYTPLWSSTLLDGNMQPVSGHPLFAKPLMDQNVETESGLPPGNYFVERRLFNETGDCVDLLPVTIPSLGADCGMVNGTAFMDYNENCLQNGEPVVPYGIVEVLPGPVYTSLAWNGTYALCLPTGDYTLTQQSASVQEHCSGGTIPFTITAGDVVQRQLPDTSLVPLDLYVSVGSGPARPGFQFQCSASVHNSTPSASGAITFTMTFDPLLTYLSAIPPPSSVTGNVLTWNQPELLGWQVRGFTVQFSVPANPGLIGTELVTTATVSSVNTDADLSNNTAADHRTITGSFDPNDKLARTSSGLSDEIYFINEDEWIDYVIRFQNTGTDTAFNILITDTLAAELDPTTLQVGASSHGFTCELRDHGVLKFYFQNILLPDSNFSEPLSHGSVGFRIRPRLPLVAGTMIENTANIFFDYNPPVITQPSVLVAEFSTSIDRVAPHDLRLAPIPTHDLLGIAADRPMSTVVVRAMDGREVLRTRENATATMIDVSGLANGAFVIEVRCADGTWLLDRFVKHNDH